MPIVFAHRHLFQRFDHELFRSRLRVHMRRWGLAYALMIIGAAMFQQHFTFGLNVSPSLPARILAVSEKPATSPRWPATGRCW